MANDGRDSADLQAEVQGFALCLKAEVDHLGRLEWRSLSTASARVPRVLSFDSTATAPASRLMIASGPYLSSRITATKEMGMDARTVANADMRSSPKMRTARLCPHGHPSLRR